MSVHGVNCWDPRVTQGTKKCFLYLNLPDHLIMYAGKCLYFRQLNGLNVYFYFVCFHSAERTVLYFLKINKDILKKLLYFLPLMLLQRQKLYFCS